MNFIYKICGHFALQGATQEQMEAMLTPEKYARYKEISRPVAEKTVKLGLLFRDILERERGTCLYAYVFFYMQLYIINAIYVRA